MSSLLISKKADLDTLTAKAEGLVNLRKSFPDMIFLHGYSCFRFLEFSICFSKTFWTILHLLAVRFGDSTVNVLVQKPGQEEYLSWGGYYGAMVLSAQSEADDYKRAMVFAGEGNNFPALYFSAINVLWFGESKRWGVYGDRDYNIAVAGLSKHAQEIGLTWPESP